MVTLTPGKPTCCFLPRRLLTPLISRSMWSPMAARHINGNAEGGEEARGTEWIDYQALLCVATWHAACPLLPVHTSWCCCHERAPQAALTSHVMCSGSCPVSARTTVVGVQLVLSAEGWGLSLGRPRELGLAACGGLAIIGKCDSRLVGSGGVPPRPPYGPGDAAGCRPERERSWRWSWWGSHSEVQRNSRRHALGENGSQRHSSGSSGGPRTPNNCRQLAVEQLTLLCGQLAALADETLQKQTLTWLAMALLFGWKRPYAAPWQQLASGSSGRARNRGSCRDTSGRNLAFGSCGGQSGACMARAQRTARNELKRQLRRAHRAAACLRGEANEELLESNPTAFFQSFNRCAKLVGSCAPAEVVQHFFGLLGSDEPPPPAAHA